jgi:hypothetical protein
MEIANCKAKTLNRKLYHSFLSPELSNSIYNLPKKSRYIDNWQKRNNVTGKKIKIPFRT